MVPPTSDQFGFSVAVAGDTLVVGAPFEDSSSTGVNSVPDELATNAGAAYVFVRSGGVWTQQAYLKPAAVGTTQVGDHFGHSVAVVGDTVVVGAPLEDSSTTGVQAGAGTPNESANGAGVVYVFMRSAGVWAQQAYLKPAAVGTTQAGDQFGSSVAVSGDTVVVGAPFEDSSSTGVQSGAGTPNEGTFSSGAAYAFVRSAGIWTQQAYFKPAAVGNMQAGDDFGWSVAVSEDTVVVGARFENSSTTGVQAGAGTPNDQAGFAGAAYVFVRSGGGWAQQAYLKPAAVGTTQAGDQFGTSVAVAGDTVVVGAINEDSSSTGVQAGAGTPNDALGASGNSGAAYIFVRSAGVWTQQAYLKPAAIGTTQVGDQFGQSVAIAGDTVVVGAPFEDSSSMGVNNSPDELASDAGAAYVFVRSGGVWTQQAYLKPAVVGATQLGDQFGTSVAIAGDTVVVGAIGEDSNTTGVQTGAGSPNDVLGASGNSGAAGIFMRSGVTWIQGAYAKANNTPPSATPSGPGAGDQFGYSVAVAGDMVIVGAPFEDSSSMGVNSSPDELASDAGAAYVFVRSGGGWTQQAYLKPAAVGTSQVGDQFGTSVAVAVDTVVVGAIGEDSSSTGVQAGAGTPDELAINAAGAAYVFVRSGGVWTQQAYLKPAAIGTTQVGDQFGQSVAVAGDTVVVGAPFEDSSFTGVQAGAGTPDESSLSAGMAYVFVRSAGMWTQQACLKPAAVGTTQEGDQFGRSVAVAGDTVVVGALGEDSSMTGSQAAAGMSDESALSAGAAHVFVRSAGVWTQQAYLKPSTVGTSQAGDQFGRSVAVTGDTLVVGAPFEDSSLTGVNSSPDELANGAGAAYVFVRNAGVWAQQAYLKPAAIGTSQGNDQFGYSVAVAGETVVVGAYQEGSSTTGVQAGAGSPNEGTFSSGAAYIFVRSAGVWTQKAYIKPAAVGTSQAADNFGASVAVAGDTVVVGTINEDSSTTGANSTADENASNSGAAYVFTLPDIDNDGLLDSWEVAQFGTTSGHSPLDDDDHDGIVNLLELGFGLNPTLPNGAALPPVTTEGNYLTLTLTKQPGVTYEVQSAGSLLPALPDSFSIITTTVLINDATTLKVRDNFLIDTSPPRFMRVKVMPAP